MGVNVGLIVIQLSSLPPKIAPLDNINIGAGVIILSSLIELRGWNELGLHIAVNKNRVVYNAVKVVAVKNMIKVMAFIE